MASPSVNRLRCPRASPLRRGQGRWRTDRLGALGGGRPSLREHLDTKRQQVGRPWRPCSAGIQRHQRGVEHHSQCCE